MPRRSSVELDAETFRRLGHRAVDRLADLLASLPSRPVTSGHDAAYLRDALGQRPAPDDGADPEELLDEITAFLIDHSLYNGHPRFMGYITSSPAPLGSLADLVDGSWWWDAASKNLHVRVTVKAGEDCIINLLQ